MPVLKNPRWEAFAQGRAAGLPAYKAYTQAGFKADKAVHVNASRLLRNAKVLARLEEIIAEASSRIAGDRRVATLELDQAIAMAHENGQASAAISRRYGQGQIARSRRRSQRGKAHLQEQLLQHDRGGSDVRNRRAPPRGQAHSGRQGDRALRVRQPSLRGNQGSSSRRAHTATGRHGVAKSALQSRAWSHFEITSGRIWPIRHICTHR